MEAVDLARRAFDAYETGGRILCPGRDYRLALARLSHCVGTIEKENGDLLVWKN
jgi:hypothetical protein